MNDMVFMVMWLYGLIITTSISYISFHVIESWFMRHIKFHVTFGLISLTLLLAGITVFSYWMSTLSNVIDATLCTALFHVGSASVVWVFKHCLHICDLPS